MDDVLKGNVWYFFSYYCFAFEANTSHPDNYLKVHFWSCYGIMSNQSWLNCISWNMAHICLIHIMQKNCLIKKNLFTDYPAAVYFNLIMCVHCIYCIRIIANFSITSFDQHYQWLEVRRLLSHRGVTAVKLSWKKIRVEQKKSSKRRCKVINLQQLARSSLDTFWVNQYLPTWTTYSA